MSKHTPGPWQCTKYPKVFSINAVSGRQIAIMTEHHGDCPEVPMSQFERSDRDAADARLIAAAPELFEALNAIAQLAHNGGVQGTTLDEMRKLLFGCGNRAMIAIAKATAGNL